MKRCLAGTGVVLGVLLLALALTWVYIGRKGETPLETWIGDQIVGVLENYITPEVQFTTLDYQAPKTVVVDGLVLTSAKTRIAALDRIVLQLAEVPRRGRPIKVQQIRVTRPHLLFRATAKGFAGWMDFVRPRAVAQPESIPQGRRFSDVLVLRHVEISDGEIVYEEAGLPNERMTLPGIDMTLDSPPVEDQPGQYALSGKLQRPPLFELGLDAQLDLDSMLLKLQRLTLGAKLDEQGRAALPPALQQFLQRHQVQGTLAAELAEVVPLKRPAAARGHLHLELKDGRVAVGEAVLPIGRGTVDGTLPNGDVDVEITDAALRSEGDTVFSLSRLALRLAGLPINGAPLDVQSLELTKPFFAFLRNHDGGWKGWRRLTSSNSAAHSHTPAVETRPATLPIVRLRHVKVRDAGLAVSVAPDATPLIVEGLEAALEIAPLETRMDAYSVRGDVRLPPLLSGALRGALHPGERTLDLDQFSARLTLNEQTYESLPAGGTFLTDHGVRGDVQVEATGTIPLDNPSAAQGQVEVDVQKGQFVYADTRWPVDSATVMATWPNGPMHIRGQGVATFSADMRLLSVESFEAEIPHIPRAGAPLEVSSVRIIAPRVHLLRNEAGALAGWDRLLPGSRHPHANDAVDAPNGNTMGARSRHGALGSPSAAKLPIIDHLSVENGEVDYQPAGAEAMVLPGVEAELTLPRSAEGGPWHDANVQVRRPPFFDTRLVGRFDPQQMVVNISDFRLQASLAEGQYDNLPPQLQTYVRKHAVRGDLQVQFEGRLPLQALNAASGRGSAELRSAHVVIDDKTWPIDAVHADVQVGDGTAQVKYSGRGLAGQFYGSGNLQMEAPHVFDVQWNVAGVQLEETLRALQQSPPRYAGKLSSEGNARGQLASLPESLSGAGQLAIRQGHLVNLPIVGQILGTLSNVRLDPWHSLDDRADVRFRLTGTGVRIEEGELSSALAQVRGDGVIGYDGSVDLVVNAGLTENVQRRLGAIGEFLGKINDRLVSFSVTGTMDDPQIGVRTLGMNE